MSCRRIITRSGDDAWMVPMDPSWPVFMAWIMSLASLPRTSPMMMRSGLMRSVPFRSASMSCPPAPSALAGLDCMGTQSSSLIFSSRASSQVMMRSSGNTKPDSTLSRVVLPLPVPPEMRMLQRARTAAARKSIMSCDIVPFPRRDSGSAMSFRNLRMDSVGHGVTGGTVAWIRLPSGMLPSSCGFISSQVRFNGRSILLITHLMSSSLEKTRGQGIFLPRTSTKVLPGPSTRMSLTSGSSMSCCMAP